MHWFLSSQLQDQLHQSIKCHFVFEHEEWPAHSSTSYYFLSEWITVSKFFSDPALFCQGTCSLFFLKVDEYQTHFAVLKCCSKSVDFVYQRTEVWNLYFHSNPAQFGYAWRLKVFQACLSKVYGTSVVNIYCKLQNTVLIFFFTLSFRKIFLWKCW